MKYKMKLLNIQTTTSKYAMSTFDKLDEEEEKDTDSQSWWSSQDSQDQDDEQLWEGEDDEGESCSESEDDKSATADLTPQSSANSDDLISGDYVNVNFPYMDKFNRTKLKSLVRKLHNKIIIKQVTTYDNKTSLKR